MNLSRTHARLAACATLAALGSAAPAVHAQTLALNSGDVVTVNGSGTKGTVGGSAVNTTTISYSSSYGTVVGTNGSAVFTLGAGGSINAGGGSYGLSAAGSGPITVSGGSITAGSGGAGLSVTGSSPVTVTGGTFTAGDNGYGLSAASSGPVTVSGGTFTAGSGGGGLIAAGSGTFTVSGGTFTAGQYGAGLIAASGSYLDLYGTFSGLTAGQIQILGYGTGSFTGKLLNNATAQTVSYINNGTITLHNVGLAAPEPSQTAALGLGVLGLAGLALRARKHKPTV